MSNRGHFLSALPWWVTIPATIIFLLVLSGLNVVLSKIFEFKPAIIWQSYLLISIVIISSAIIGALVARLTASQQITRAEDELNLKYDDVKKLLTSVQRQAEDMKKQSLICQNYGNSLSLVVSTLKQVIQGKFGEALITYEDLKQIENSVRNNTDIWVLTSALELEDNELKQVIISNFKKGVKYKYLIPAEDRVLQQIMKALALDWQKTAELSVAQANQQIQCYLVPQHFAYMTVIIYDPYKSPPTVLVKFPTSEFYQKEKYPLIYRVDSKPKEAWNIFLEAFQDLIDDGRKCKLTQPLKFDFEDKQ